VAKVDARCADRPRCRRSPGGQPGGRAGRGAAGCAHRACARCRSHGRCPESVGCRRPAEDLRIGPGDKRMSRTYFGTDGIRGTVGQAPITPDFMLRLGHAVGTVLRSTEKKPTVLIGKDTRISGYMLESSLEAGFASAGVDVLLTGPLPTPGVAYMTRALRLDLGVVISASHNPYGDNGVKFFSAQGEKLPDEWETAVETALEEPAQWVDSRA